MSELHVPDERDVPNEGADPGDPAAPGDGADTGNGRIEAHGVLAKLAWGLLSEPGDVRPHNEDCAGAFAPTIPDDAWDRGPLFLVCDGLGGHAAGEVASRLAVESALQSWTNGGAQAAKQAIRASARAANLAVYDASLQAGQRGMGTTFTGLTLAGREAHIAHVGDSRAFLIRKRTITQLTADHSRVGEMLRMRLITPEQAANHPARSALTRSLGGEPIVQIDLVTQPVETGDVFLLCSDGLWDTLPRAELAEVSAAIGSRDVPTPADAAATLVASAVGQKAPDNVTAVVVKVTSDRPIPAATGRRSFFRRGGR